MKLNPIASNMTEVEIGDKTVLFSYKTPVAYFEKGLGYITEKYWSVTTSRHTNKWLKSICLIDSEGPNVSKVPQEFLDNLVK